jgi:hypothetical protein
MKEIKVPQRTVEGLSQDELDAAARARQGLGAFQPLLILQEAHRRQD